MLQNNQDYNIVDRVDTISIKAGGIEQVRAVKYERANKGQAFVKSINSDSGISCDIDLNKMEEETKIKHEQNIEKAKNSQSSVVLFTNMGILFACSGGLSLLSGILKKNSN
jgi:hypothetical protein